jgi:hypothetical protein
VHATQLTEDFKAIALGVILIPILRTRYPDPWKIILQQQVQNMLRILAIRLLLAFAFPTDLRRISDPQLNVQFGEQSFKPARMPARFHPNTYLHFLCGEIAVELLRFFTLLQSPLLQFPSFRIHKSNLILIR